MTEICNECGESVAQGSGKFVNRVPDLNTAEERVEMGKPHPEGDFMCAECDDKIREDKGMAVAVTVEKAKDVLTSYLDREPTQKELELFIDYLEVDVPQWLVDNAKHWVQEVLPNEE